MAELWAGPWCGEFGFEIATWQGHVRHRASVYDLVCVGCRPESQALYADFADRFWDVPNKTWDDMNTNCHKRVDGKESEIARAFERQARQCKGDIMTPASMSGKPGGSWRKFGKPTKGMEYDLLLHARYMRKGSKGGDMRRSAPQEWWDDLGSTLLKDGYNVASIGLSTQALHVAGTHDILDTPLGTLMDVMASSKCIIGASSGPIHLAAMCMLPAVVWTHMKHKGYGGLTNTQRLKRNWNPFKTAVRLIDVDQDAGTEFWIPPQDEVVELIEETLDEQAGRTVAAHDGGDPLGAQ